LHKHLVRACGKTEGGTKQVRRRKVAVGEHDESAKTPEHLAPLVEALRADPQKAAYYLGLLKPLEQYDRDRNGDLLKTLAVYLEHAGNSVRAADTLFLHRNSLRYRLARIQALMGMDPDDPDARLTLAVALLLLKSTGRSL
jgi:DNA-binding PucR family transcriptional regulator